MFQCKDLYNILVWLEVAGEAFLTFAFFWKTHTASASNYERAETAPVGSKVQTVAQYSSKFAHSFARFI